jgi:hypothetical protein
MPRREPKVASGIGLIEVSVTDEDGEIVDLRYVVTGVGALNPLYQGPSIPEAVAAFAKTARC